MTMPLCQNFATMGVILLCMDVRPTAASRPKHEIEHIDRESYVVRPLQKNADLVLTGSGHLYRTHPATTAEKEASAVMPAEPAGVASLAEKFHVQANSTLDPGMPGILKEGQTECKKLPFLNSLVQIGDEKADALDEEFNEAAGDMYTLCMAIDGGSQGAMMCSLMTTIGQWTTRIGPEAARTGITPKEAMAIGIYTAPDAYKMIWASYTGASIYRGSTPAQNAAMENYKDILTSVLKSQIGKRKPTAVLYTGLDQGGLLKTYEVGATVRLLLPVSTTTDRDVAASFAVQSCRTMPDNAGQCHHIILEITNMPDNAINIEKLSCFPHEAEHLFGPGAFRFTVASNDETFSRRGKTVHVVKGKIS